jgi:hypothetical protein
MCLAGHLQRRTNLVAAQCRRIGMLGAHIHRATSFGFQLST